MQQPPPVDELLGESAAFAGRVARALSEPGVDWHWKPSQEAWNLTQVLCHLRDVEREVHQPRFRQLIESEDAFIAGQDPDAWADQRQYHLQSGPAALTAFRESRRETVELLRDLDDPIWQRQGRHAFFGNTTMHELLNLTVGHDRSHWEQIQWLLEGMEN